MKYLFLFVVSFLLFQASISFAQIQIGQDIDGHSKFGTGTAISANGTRVAVGATMFNTGGSQDGYVVILGEVNGNWIQIGQEIYGEAPGDRAGNVSMSADGARIIIGGNGNSVNGAYTGHARVFEEISGGWAQIGQDLDGTTSYDNFGVSVSMSADGSRVAIGGTGKGTSTIQSGYVRVFDEVNGSWVQVGQDIYGEAEFDDFGLKISISADGNRIAVSGPGNDAGGYSAGHARVYEEINGSWTQIGQDLDGDNSYDSFGNSISISADGTRVAIGAPKYDFCQFCDDIGQVKVFDDVNGTWVQVGQDIIGESQYDKSGSSISISANGKRIAIGAPDNYSYFPRAGHVRIYEEKNGNWINVRTDIDGEGDLDKSGNSVSISADGARVLIGASLNDGNGPDSGHARVYKLNGIGGTLFLDNNTNCNFELSEIGKGNIPVLINPGNYIVETNASGFWDIELPAGNYTCTIDTTSHWKTTCQLPQTFTVFHPDSFAIAPGIGIYSKYPCPSPDISIVMPFIRRCFSDQIIRVQACNTNLATGTFYNPIILATFDPQIIPTSFELPPISLGNNQYQFELDSLLPGQCKDFWVKATIDCSAELGQALCMRAEILPVTPCMLDSIPNPFPPTVQPCNGEWDESSLVVTGYCSNDTVFFEITNLGVGNMNCFHPVNIYLDDFLLIIDSVKLNAQQISTYFFPASGESWHLEVEQHPNHPGNSNPKATLENCGGSTAQTRINNFALDDADPVIDLYCEEVTGSYDPNDKTGYPFGVTSDHHIEANQQIQYRIRFQNTGTAPAITVVIRDTLDINLDLLSVRVGVSSHTYDFRMYGQGVLEWTFNNIMLPDSNANEPASHGFVFFTVDQLPDLPHGTQITNSAGIYFDFNAPIITNTSQHQIHYDILSTDIGEVTVEIPNIVLYPNPNNGQFFIDLNQHCKLIAITITDITGRIMVFEEYQNKSGIPIKIDNGSGIYLVKVAIDNGASELFKVVMY